MELVINGKAVDKKEITADGTEQEVSFQAPVNSSSWVCLRIFPSSHTNPLFVVVDGKPIRVSKRSADWCLKAIDRCWKQKSRLIRASEKAEASAAYDKARAAYKKIMDECAAD